jgi:hypothetical protein
MEKTNLNGREEEGERMRERSEWEGKKWEHMRGSLSGSLNLAVLFACVSLFFLVGVGL